MVENGHIRVEKKQGQDRKLLMRQGRQEAILAQPGLDRAGLVRVCGFRGVPFHCMVLVVTSSTERLVLFLTYFLGFYHK